MIELQPFELGVPGHEDQARQFAFSDAFPAERIDARSLTPDISGMGSLYVGARAVHPDGMLLAMSTPRRPFSEISAAYQDQSTQPGFSDADFWTSNFETPQTDDRSLVAPAGMDLREYTRWIRQYFIQPNVADGGSIIGLPNDTHAAGGGRYLAPIQFEWDTYHVTKGLAADGQWDKVLATVNNTEYLINRLGYAPNASATFMATRSQPPYFSHEVSMLADKYGEEALIRYLPTMEKEYNYWMDGEAYLAEQPDDGQAYTHRTLVRLPAGDGKFTYLNRYWDDADGPRLESYQEDVGLGEMVTHGLTGEVRERRLAQLYKDIRSGAASGWDQSTRFFQDGHSLATINTTEVIPVDLNSLLARSERMLTLANRAAGNVQRAQFYDNRYKQRISAINRFLWDDDGGLYRDYNFVRRHQTGIVSAATAYPLYVGIANPRQTSGVARVIEEELLMPGGLITTTSHDSDQQWDGQNVWAPLNWAAARGLSREAHMAMEGQLGVDVEPWLELSERLRSSYMDGLETAFKAHGTTPEKHRGDNPAQIGQGGEYQAVAAFAMSGEIFVAMDAWDPRDPNGCLPIGSTALAHAV